MASKILLCSFILLSLQSLSSCDDTDSIAEAPSAFKLNTNHGSFDLQGFSSFLLRGFKFGSRGPRKLANGFHSRGRITAEKTGRNKTFTAGAPAPAQAPAPAPMTSPVDRRESKSKAWKWLAGIALGLVTGTVCGIIAALIAKVTLYYLRRSKPEKPVVYQRKFIDAKAIVFLEEAIASDSLEVLGKGGSGEVYKATLQSGRVVAIKKVLGFANINIAKSGPADPMLEQSYDLTKNSAQVRAELDTLGQIRHRNLVTLLAYIPKPNTHMLVYDYMENGSLYSALLRVREDKLELTWPMRLNIARGVAMGLKYLHVECVPRIVHCDLKPGNILLDKDMEPHIGDFGLAKIIPDSMTHCTSNNLAGTVGYIAPEYHQTLRYTMKGDVYSFGVILIVLLTGKEPTHHLFSDVCTHMGQWLADLFAAGAESMMDVVDSTLRGRGDEEQMLSTFKVALFCLNVDPGSRPTSSHLVAMLDQISSSSQPAPTAGLPLEALAAQQ